jgi:putative peptidoglycan lipid II flippase
MPSPDSGQVPDNEKSAGARRLLRSSSVVGSMTMISRVMGLLRDICFAHVIGDKPAADAFYVAFKVPQFLRRLFAEGAFSQAFVPVLSEYRVNGTQAAVQELIDRVCGCLGFVLLGITIPIVVFAPAFTMLFAPGFYMHSPEKFVLASEMVRITFPYLFLISLTGFAGAVLNSYDRFAVPAFTPVLLNVSLIFAALVMMPWFDEPVLALAWGVFMAGALQLVFQLPFLARIRMLPRPKVDFKHEGVKRILTLMIPAMFGVSVGQINLFLDTIIASFLPSGSVARLYYADRIYDLPLGVFAIAVSTVILPSLSRDFAKQDFSQFSAKLDWSMRVMLLLSVPAALALLILAKPILITLFYYGEHWSPDGVQISAFCLQAYSMGLLAFMVIKVLVPGYYARQDMRTPVRIGIICMVSNMVLNLIIVTPLHFYFDMGVVGLAAASTLAAFLNMGLLLKGLLDAGIYKFAPDWRQLSLRMGGASLAMCLVLWVLMHYMTGWLDWVWYERAFYLAILCVSGIATYFGVLYASGMRWSDFHIQME